jgi:hypothetical protein
MNIGVLAHISTSNAGDVGGKLLCSNMNIEATVPSFTFRHSFTSRHYAFHVLFPKATALEPWTLGNCEQNGFAASMWIKGEFSILLLGLLGLVCGAGFVLPLQTSSTTITEQQNRQSTRDKTSASKTAHIAIRDVACSQYCSAGQPAPEELGCPECPIPCSLQIGVNLCPSRYGKLPLLDRFRS